MDSFLIHLRIQFQRPSKTCICAQSWLRFCELADALYLKAQGLTEFVAVPQ